MIVDPRFNEVQTDEQIEMMMPRLTEQNADFAKLVAMMDKDTKSLQKIIETVFNYWVRLPRTLLVACGTPNKWAPVNSLCPTA